MADATSPTDALQVTDTASHAPALRAHHVLRGWTVAWLTGLAVTGGLAVLLLYVPHWLLVSVPAWPRTFRALLATGWTAGVTALLIIGAARAAARQGRSP